MNLQEWHQKFSRPRSRRQPQRLCLTKFYCCKRLLFLSLFRFLRFQYVFRQLNQVWLVCGKNTSQYTNTPCAKVCSRLLGTEWRFSHAIFELLSWCSIGRRTDGKNILRTEVHLRKYRFACFTVSTDRAKRGDKVPSAQLFDIHSGEIPLHSLGSHMDCHSREHIF